MKYIDGVQEFAIIELHNSKGALFRERGRKPTFDENLKST